MVERIILDYESRCSRCWIANMLRSLDSKVKGSLEWIFAVIMASADGQLVTPTALRCTLSTLGTTRHQSGVEGVHWEPKPLAGKTQVGLMEKVPRGHWFWLSTDMYPEVTSSQIFMCYNVANVLDTQTHCGRYSDILYQIIWYSIECWWADLISGRSM